MLKSWQCQKDGAVPCMPIPLFNPEIQTTNNLGMQIALIYVLSFNNKSLKVL